MSFQFYISWKSLIWGLPTYIYNFVLSGKIAEINLIFFAGKNILCKNTKPEVFFCFTIYHMIYRNTSNKVHHM